MNINKELIEVVNSKGMVVRHQGDWNDNKFGKSNIITIEGSQFRITFVTNVLHGINYFNIIQVTDLYINRTYKASRFFTKFISLISEINGQTFIKLCKECNS